jgi:hypothetical protein
MEKLYRKKLYIILENGGKIALNRCFGTGREA